MALSTKELIRNIPAEPDTKNARYVNIFATKRLAPASFRFITVTKIPGDFTRKHYVWIKDQDAKDVMSSQNIYVSCDCKRFTYKWEYALYKRKATTIRFSNGEPPIETNPKMIPAACKHVFRCLNNLAKQRPDKQRFGPDLPKK